MDVSPVTSSSAPGPVTFSQVFGQQCQLMEAAVESLHSLNDQISHFIVNKSKTLDEDEDAFLPSEKESLKNAMMLMRHLLMDAQIIVNITSCMTTLLREDPPCVVAMLSDKGTPIQAVVHIGPKTCEAADHVFLYHSFLDPKVPIDGSAALGFHLFLPKIRAILEKLERRGVVGQEQGAVGCSYTPHRKLSANNLIFIELGELQAPHRYPAAHDTEFGGDKCRFVCCVEDFSKGLALGISTTQNNPQAKILHMMDDNKQLALRIDGALQAAGQEVTALRAELAATGRRLAELGSEPAMEHGPHSAQDPCEEPPGWGQSWWTLVQADCSQLHQVLFPTLVPSRDGHQLCDNVGDLTQFFATALAKPVGLKGYGELVKHCVITRLCPNTSREEEFTVKKLSLSLMTIIPIRFHWSCYFDNAYFCGFLGRQGFALSAIHQFNSLFKAVIIMGKVGTSEGQGGSWKMMLPIDKRVSGDGWVLLTFLGAEMPIIDGQRSTQGGLVAKFGLFLGEEYQVFSRVASEGEWNAEVVTPWSVTISVVMETRYMVGKLVPLQSDVPEYSHGALLREEVAQLQEEVHLLRQMKEMLTKDLEETHGSKSPEVLSATELKVQLAQKEHELARAKEALHAMKADRKRLKGEKTDLVSQMQQLYATLESREEQLRDFIRNYEQHRKAKQSLATLTKDVPKRHSLAMPGETVLNGNQEWVMQADLPLTAAIRQSQQTLYHSHPQHSADRQAVRVSPCHSRQPSIISDASAAEGDRSSTPSDINSPRHRTHSLCNGDSPGPVQKNLHNPIVQSLEDLEDQKRKKKKEKMGFGSISRVFARGKQRKSLDPGLFDGTAPDYYIEEDADW
ncbi:Kazn [Columba guinea]|nr:Kazn [Columba guinea]